MVSETLRKIILESLPILVIVLVFALVTGQILDSGLDFLVPIFPFILLMVPAFIDITGDLAGIVGAHVTTHLYTGELDSHFRPYRLVFTNIIAVLIVSATAYAFLGICVLSIAYLFYPHLIALGLLSPTYYPNPQYILSLFAAILIAGVAATACTSLIGLFGARLVYRSGRDPDSIIPPITTTIGDLFGISFITIALLFIA